MRAAQMQEITMTDRDPITLIPQATYMIGDDLEGYPRKITCPGKEDFVLVSSAPIPI